jgi:hypothetical protein
MDEIVFCPKCAWIGYSYEKDINSARYMHCFKIKYGSIKKKSENTPHCPICNSTKIQKISMGSKVGSAALFGIFAIGKLNKTFECLDCGYKF